MFFNKKNSVTEAQVLEKLREVNDPDLNRDIVTLGFVKDLKIKGGDVSFKVELTTPACPVKEQLKSECDTKVRSISGVTSVEIEMTSNVRSHQPGPSASVPGSTKVSLPNIKNMIAVASGKGGVGKSTVAVNLALALAKEGAKVGLLDADIYGPSIPIMMGVKRRPDVHGEHVHPIEKDGIKLISMGFLVPENQAVVWRGPMVHGALTQFLTQVQWGELDYLIIDMPPGTGDAQLTMSQTAPLSGAIIVTTPQEVSLLDARRGLLMFQNVKVPVLGVVENMSGFVCSHCDEVTPIFRTGGGKKIADEFQVPFLGGIPIDPLVAEGGDLGKPIVLAQPDSEVAKRFISLAGQVASKLSTLQFQSTASFKPVGLSWQT